MQKKHPGHKNKAVPEAGGGESFEARVSSILDELALGMRWERPSLILAIYRSETIKDKAQRSLHQTLERSATPVFHYQVDRAHYDIPIDLREHPGHAQAVYFIEGLSRGGGRGYSNAYRALNMHRETLVEAEVKAVFWLTGLEARQLPRFAPDFWAFRHKVVEFYDLPAEKESSSGGGRGRRSAHLYLNASPELLTRARNAERLAELGCPTEAVLELREILRACPQEKAIRLQIAEVQLSMGQIQAARRMLKKVEKSGTEQPELIKELERLNHILGSSRSPRGGLQEDPAGES